MKYINDNEKKKKKLKKKINSRNSHFSYIKKLCYKNNI